MDLSTTQIIIAIVGGFFAGVINTLAGNGSAITLTILTEVIGLPANLSNATNRIGVLSQGLSSVSIFWRNNRAGILKGRWIIFWILIGSILGIIAALKVSNEQFRLIFSYLMVVLLGIVLVNPKKWLRRTDFQYKMPAFLMVPLYLALGIYAGFIQMGMGVLFLMVTVLLGRFSLIDANAIKNIVVTLLTVFAILLFQWRGWIDWPVGLTIAIGQASGGYLAAKFAAQHPKASLWAYRLLIIVMILAVVKLFDLHTFFL